jgi:hypothetical protein
VPLVPEECFLGVGYRLEDSTGVTLDLSDGPAPARSVKARHLVFVRDRPGDGLAIDGQRTVMYFFRVNGQYANDRTEARQILMKNVFGKHSFFSKVEWSFLPSSGVSPPTLEQAVNAGEKLVSRLLPTLEKDHWPEWEKLNREK